jgi:hypothetical protein
MSPAIDWLSLIHDQEARMSASEIDGSDKPTAPLIGMQR